MMNDTRISGKMELSRRPEQGNYPPWRKGVYRLLRWAGQHLTGSHITIAAVYILARSQDFRSSGKQDDFGLTFEDDGLRARAIWQRE